MPWEVRSNANDHFYHAYYGFTQCREAVWSEEHQEMLYRDKQCTNKDHNICEHWTLEYQDSDEVHFLADTSEPSKARWFRKIADKLNSHAH